MNWGIYANPNCLKEDEIPKSFAFPRLHDLIYLVHPYCVIKLQEEDKYINGKLLPES